MLCERNDDVIYYTLLSLFIACISACEKVSRHKHHSSINAACAQRGELACISEANVEICRQLVQQKKNIQSTYFWYDSDISKCKRSFCPILHSINAASVQILSNATSNADSCLWCHSLSTFVHFKRYFYSIKITLASGRLINTDKLTFD